ncbi:glycosyltransferase family 4 protein [Clostridium sp. MT-14]|uniref:glycosyltransferase family 4 protein n=1 Tax=Clostridium sp. MT-14 TaxID=3348360 RepID=UPI0035F43944
MKGYNIAVIGGYPPPIGGISVHIKRLIKKLDDKYLQYVLYNTSKNKIKVNYNIFNVNNLKLWLIKYFFCCKDKIIHCQERNWYLLFILCLIKKIHKSKLILTIHSFREEPKKFNFLKKLCFYYSMKNVDQFIPVGENEKLKLIKYNCDISKIDVIPAYINPDYDESDDKLIPNYIWNFMKDNDFNIVANAYKISFYKNEDLYGIDMCVELCSRLKKYFRFKKIGFVFCLPDIGDYEYYSKLKNIIGKLQIRDRFLLVNEKIPLCPILKKSNLFLRPTNTDSYGISIAEALYYKVPSITSDVCRRPKGAILFKTRNIKDLYNKTVDVIENYKFYKKKLKNIKVEDNYEKLLNIYRKLVNI